MKKTNITDFNPDGFPDVPEAVLSEFMNPPAESESPEEGSEEWVLSKIRSFERIDINDFYDLADRLYEFRKSLDEETAAYLLFKGYLSTCKVLCDVPKEAWNDEDPSHIRDVRFRNFADAIEHALSTEEVNALNFRGDEAIHKFKKIFRRFGVKTISSDRLWQVCEMCESEKTALPFGACDYSKYWILFELWRDVFEDKLVFILEKNENYDDLNEVSEHILDAILERPYTDGNGNREKNFISLVDRVEWPEGLVYSGLSSERDMDVIRTEDEELLLMCLEKNIIPRENIPFIIDRIGDGYSKLMPLLILFMHGFTEEKSRCSK